MTLHLDIETRSRAPITDCGNYHYAMDDSFDILLVAYAYGDDPVRVVDLASGEPMPESLVKDIVDGKVWKVAHNAVFERVCFTMWLRRRGLLGPDQWLGGGSWICTMTQAVRCGLPQSLAQVGEVLGFEKQKMAEGKRLIKLFCLPHETKGLFSSEWADPTDFPDDWGTFKSYCKRDVEVERQIYDRLSWYPISIFEQRLYAVDQRINDRGVRIDRALAVQASRMDAFIKAKLNKEAIELTGLGNPNSVSQLKGWVNGRLGTDLETLRKADIADLKGNTGDPVVDRVLQIRAEMGKTSCAKYDAMLSVACSDDRARGLTQFYGSRTGRWAGRLIQMQNLPQNHLDSLDFARQCLRDGDYTTLELCFGNVPDVMSQLIRTAFIPADGRVFAVCDFSAIEARVLAWEAGETWVLDTFRRGDDIYCATASQMFHVPVEKHGRNAGLRQKGKIAVLALGYGGGPAALDKMGGQRMGMTEDEERETVRMWRDANPNIVRLWKEYETAARRAIVYRTAETAGPCVFRMHDDTLTVTLPSGRRITYPNIEIFFEQEWAYLDQTEAQAATSTAENRIAKEKRSKHLEKYGMTDGRLRFRGMNQTTKKWEWIETYGGKLTENITQAIARDCLAEVMVRLDGTEGVDVCFHVHDEVVCEVPDESYLALIKETFSAVPGWAEGLPLVGDGYTGDYYFKN